MVADFDRHRPRFFDFVKCVVSRGSGIYSTVNTSLGVLLLAPRASQAWPCERRDQRARAGGAVEAAGSLISACGALPPPPGGNGEHFFTHSDSGCASACGAVTHTHMHKTNNTTTAPPEAAQRLSHDAVHKQSSKVGPRP